MVQIIHRYAVYFWYYFSVQFQQIFEYYILGMLIGSVISVFGKTKIHALLCVLQKHKLGALGLIPASVIGIASPLCMYGTIPLAASFSEKGVQDDWLAAFMMSSILLNPQLLFYSAALGKAAFVTRLVSCFLCGVLAGACVRCFCRNKKFFSFAGFREGASHDTNPNMLLRLIFNIGRNVRTTGLYFLVGVILSALFQTFVPQDAFARIFGTQGPRHGFGLLMAATVGVPLYMCGGGTIPLLQAWLENGMSLGAASAFMLTGPATKITNLGALKIVLGAKNFALYITFSIVFALVCGFGLDYIVGVMF
jgi:uncharacterized membrane protein YraQ (UPF0718 family)